MAIIRGSEGTVRIGSDSYTLKKTLNYFRGAEPWSDSVRGQFIKHVGNVTDYFDAELYAERSELAGLFTLATPDSNGGTNDRTIQVTYTDVDGSSTTISGTGFLSSVEIIDADAEQKLVVKIHVEYRGTPTLS